ncbi:MAG: hypothetical protein SWY16_04965 [Cyanobacteriota bacterium]|nr:hypothetical protein [Cyanobacteriota bacterium]
MSSVFDIHATQPQNLRSLRKLSRIISLSQGQFSLVLACANHPQFARYVTESARNATPVSIEEFVLPPSSQTLYTAVREQLGDRQPQALAIFGLEAVTDIEQVLGSANMMRNELFKQFPFPIILWIDDRTLVKLRRVAPDLRNCSGNPIRFEAVQCESDSKTPPSEATASAIFGR